MNPTIKRVITGTRKYKNLVFNGDFNKGASGWFDGDGFPFSEVKIIGGVAIYTLTAQYGGINHSAAPINAIPLRNKIVYAFADIKASSANVVLNLNDGLAQTGVPATGDNIMHRKSFLFTVNAASTAIYITVQDNRASGWTETQVGHFAFLCLPDIFGAGSEPSLEWCDKNIPQNIIW